MKVLFVNEKCGYFGGVELNVAQVAEALRARGHQCFLAYGSETDRDAGGYAGLFDGSFGCVELGAPAGPAVTPRAIRSWPFNIGLGLNSTPFN